MIILNYLYTIWCFFIFIIFLLIAIPVYLLASLLPYSKSIQIFMGYNRFWVNTWSFLTQFKVNIINQDKIDPNTMYVFVANHISMLDVVIVNIAIQHTITSIGKIEVKKIPLMGYLFDKAIILVDRKDPESRQKSFAKALELAKYGISVFLFPEGTRNKTGQTPLLPFKTGAFRMALDLKRPIAYFVMTGVRACLPNDKMPIKSREVTCIFGEPIPTQNYKPEDYETLCNDVRIKMEELIIEHDPDFKHLKK